MSLARPVAVVTGAGRNLGRAIALELGRIGADVAVNVRTNRAEGEVVCDEIRALGVRASLHVADISDEHSTIDMFKSISDVLGPPTILVNNAGPRGEGLIEELTTEDWNNVVGAVLTGAFYCCRAVVPVMKERRNGRIISILGAVAHVGQGRRAHLAAAKSGLLGMTRALATELGPFGITVNAVSPGPLNTILPPGLDPQVRLRRALDKPIPRLGEAQEVAELVTYLASPAASFVTGQAIGINGGEVMLS